MASKIGLTHRAGALFGPGLVRGSRHMRIVLGKARLQLLDNQLPLKGLDHFGRRQLHALALLSNSEQLEPLLEHRLLGVQFGLQFLRKVCSILRLIWLL